MSLKPAICTQCGGQIEVDDSKEAGICQFCGTAFITEKVIHQYVTQNNFAGATINIQGGVDDENLYMLARRAVEQNNVADILKYYGQLVERHPNDWEAVFYSSFFKGDDTIVLPNLELALNLLFDSVVITKENYDEIWPKVWKMLSFYLERQGGEHYSYSNQPKKLGTQPLLIILQNLLDKEINKNKNKINYNIRLIIWAINETEWKGKYISWNRYTRESLLKVFKLEFDENLSEKDKEIILELFLGYFDFFMKAPYFLNLSVYNELIESCPYIDAKEKKLIFYRNFIKNFSGEKQFKYRKKELYTTVKNLESELPKAEREFTNKLKKEKKDKRMGCLCFFLVILLIGGFFFFGFLNAAEMSIKEFFQELFKLIKGE